MWSEMYDDPILFVKNTKSYCETYQVTNVLNNFLLNLTHATDTLAMSTPNATIVEVMQSAFVMKDTTGTANIVKVRSLSKAWFLQTEAVIKSRL